MTELDPVCDDLSAFIISGRVRGRLDTKPQYETDARTPAMGIDDGVAAERLGFRRAWIAERMNLKESTVILSAVGARTTRLNLASGIVAAGSRHPVHLAAYGATMQAVHGERFTLGIGRGAPAYAHGGHVGFRALSDLATILKRLWAGEQFEYNGPVGNLGHIGLDDTYPGNPPEIWAGIFGMPQGAKAVAETPAIDGVLMPAILTPDGAHTAVTYIRDACERAGRDPSTLRIATEVITCPDLEEEEIHTVARARSVTYLQPEAWSKSYEHLNGWDIATLEKLRAHPMFTGVGGGTELADLKFHRVDLKEPAKLLPEEWIQDSCAIGTVNECVTKLQQFKDAGVDEIATYGTTPGQNAELIAAWRTHSAQRQPALTA